VKISLAFSASYDGLVNNLQRIEQLSPYLSITDFEIIQSQEKTGEAEQIKMSLRSPLRASGGPGGGLLAAANMPPPPIALARSPFNEKLQRAPVVDLENLRLTGITWRKDASTAIVNDQVVRVGDKVNELSVTQIFPDQVIISDGSQTYTIPLNK
jgi:hypothetical protein